MENYISLFAQILEIIGAFLLWKFGLPKHIKLNSGNSLSSSCSTPEEYKKENEDNRRYKKMCKRGFLLILFGFILNLAVGIYIISKHVSQNVRTDNCAYHHRNCEKNKSYRENCK